MSDTECFLIAGTLTIHTIQMAPMEDTIITTLFYSHFGNDE